MTEKAQDAAILTAQEREALPFRISLESANRAVGLIALGLPLALLLVGTFDAICPGINSISHYYYSPLGGDILVGALSVIGVLMLFFYKLPKAPRGGQIPVEGYKGHHPRDIWLARLAGLCAFGVAFSPTGGTGCEDFAGSAIRTFLIGTQGGDIVGLPEALRIPDLPLDQQPAVAGIARFDLWHALKFENFVFGAIHYASAAVMFAILAYYSLVVFTRNQKAGPEDAEPVRFTRKWWRNLIYRACGAVIIGCLVALAVQFALLPEGLKTVWNAANGTFWVEALALFAFGISWSVKGRIFAVLRDRGEPNPRRAAVQAAAA